jgi:hypothetical protein
LVGTEIIRDHRERHPKGYTYHEVIAPRGVGSRGSAILQGQEGWEMRADGGLRRVVIAIVGAGVSFFLVAAVIYDKVADVKVNGVLRGGPTALAAAMAGLFGGGLAAVVVMVLLLRWRGGGR